MNERQANAMNEGELPQLDDPHVRRMADRNHRPREMWSVAGDLLALACDECGRRWPCPTRLAVDAIEGRGNKP